MIADIVIERTRADLEPSRADHRCARGRARHRVVGGRRVRARHQAGPVVTAHLRYRPAAVIRLGTPARATTEPLAFDAAAIARARLEAALLPGCDTRPTIRLVRLVRLVRR